MYAKHDRDSGSSSWKNRAGMVRMVRDTYSALAFLKGSGACCVRRPSRVGPRKGCEGSQDRNMRTCRAAGGSPFLNACCNAVILPSRPIIHPRHYDGFRCGIDKSWKALDKWPHTLRLQKPRVTSLIWICICKTRHKKPDSP